MLLRIAEFMDQQRLRRLAEGLLHVFDAIGSADPQRVQAC